MHILLSGLMTRPSGRGASCESPLKANLALKSGASRRSSPLAGVYAQNICVEKL
jgi:hypothetical protein